ARWRERSLRSMELQLQFLLSKADDLHDWLRVQLLEFSQQLCDRLEQLVLTYASYNLLCLDETKPNSVSHFCVGQSWLGPLRVTAFRYCKPTAYLARADTGLYKRMRWNVERLEDEQQTDDESEEVEVETVGDTDQGSVVRMWSIGQWVQVTPITENIYDWIMCEVPQANYHRLLYLGSEEPSSCCATDYLQQLLLSHQTPE
uniref:Si:ch211-214c7.5 n=1 Tax=Cyclopterus lumpus TaxID=8103 RepID=A0A8C2Z498_CYCLU